MKSKKEIKTYFRSKRQPVDSKIQKKFEANILPELFNLLDKTLSQSHSLIASYLSSEFELNLNQLNESQEYKERIVLPRVIDFKARSMDFCHMDEGENFRAGISQPSKKQKRIEPERIEIFLVPCFIADYSGNRIGSGYGFYDRFFASIKENNFISVGVVLESNLLGSIPREKHDLKLDYLITESNIYTSK